MKPYSIFKYRFRTQKDYDIAKNENNIDENTFYFCSDEKPNKQKLLNLISNNDTIKEVKDGANEALNKYWK